MIFYETISAAIRDIEDHGYDSVQRVEYWLDQIRQAAAASLVPERVLEEKLRQTLTIVYTRMVDKGGLLKLHPGIPKFTYERIKPKLRGELDRRIMASSNLIKLNRQDAIQTTLRRFSGWATSIPDGGSDTVNRRNTSIDLRKGLARLPFEERRVAIDQGHKFVANLSNILATDGGAIAAIWHSHWRQANYDYREDHKERDRKVYAVRGCWAFQQGLMKPGPAGYLDDITQPGEEVFCRCYAQYVYSIRDLPPEMLTVKGKAELQRARDLVRQAIGR